jgi:hypothetical protein
LQISSNDVFLSRTTINEKSSGASLCGLFITPGNPTSVSHPLTYFPKNVLSSSVTYNSLNFDVRSKYYHQSMNVTKEVYEYSLVMEIRHV